MFIAHAPAGYLMAVSLLRRMGSAAVSPSAFILAAMVGAVAPDFDLAYFYLVDDRTTPHRQYLTHWPLLWLSLAAVCAVWLRRTSSAAARLLLVFCLGGVLHLILDSLAGRIWWFAPFVDKSYALIAVPAQFKPWWLNFVWHWSAASELVICAWALSVYRRQQRRAAAFAR